MKWPLTGSVVIANGMRQMYPLAQLWLLALLLVNVIWPIWYWQQPIAKATVAALLIQGVLMVWLAAKYGYSRILGVAHFMLWPLLQVWLACELLAQTQVNHYAAWLVCILLLNTISLVLDGLDTLKFWRGDRAPVYE